MDNFLTFAVTGDKSFDFFFSLPASLAILFFIVTTGVTMFRGR
jgi:hypothetical protein